ATSSPCATTLAVPDSITKNPTPCLPSSAMTSPALKSRSLKCGASFSASLSSSVENRSIRCSSLGSIDIAESLNRFRALDALCQLLDLPLRRVEPLATEPIELLSALPEGDRVVERDVSRLEALDDLRQLLLCLLEGHRQTSPTVPEKPPSARRTSISSPEESVVAVRTTVPSCRTIA